MSEFNSSLSLPQLSEYLAESPNKASASVLTHGSEKEWQANLGLNRYQNIGFVSLFVTAPTLICSVSDKLIQQFCTVEGDYGWFKGYTAVPNSIVGFNSLSAESFAHFCGTIHTINLPIGYLEAHLISIGAFSAIEFMRQYNQIVVTPAIYRTYKRLHHLGSTNNLRDENQILDFFTILLQSGADAPPASNVVTKNWDLIYQMVRTTHQDGGEPLNVSEIAKSLFTSGSCLTTACHNCFGTSPGKLHEQVRMTQVHVALLNPPPNYTVKSAMRRFGFNHAGRFSAKYKSIFGHLPSEGIQVFKDARRETNSQQLSLF